MPQYPTWFFPVLFQGFDLIIDQRHVIPAPYEALTQIVNGAIDGDNQYYGIPNGGGNIFYTTTLYKGTKATKTIPLQVNLTPLMHYLCDGIVRVLFDDNPDPQVLSMEVIGEIGGSIVRSG
ncbi:MAG: hypothetical protein EZS28_033964 [Streblomastix strix]|uniref:Uncharacterized protein n=1 Tax=Streblomastix strix TaxID=222440 RepID=A0A5J4UIN2_9EUKA|nr:MAG: hypothetical protein EZS28_033964 [Streblomastix strix]